ncbi:hypothetical protein CPAR01_06227 [Colletotrichum paranaense]|uniref:Uncharacterized protein n=1 Tax=Colletotrichum paranaense TaxID=1914294 RepID=A0ABQ9SU59_9PEZI|nr:uncharacterized protein CPAR01_06227 [Colletotrichum paranaense]KAK1542840.1 hypothetical protein CPAR01_06227 [Colletotrichum paranaense]
MRAEEDNGIGLSQEVWGWGGYLGSILLSSGAFEPFGSFARRLPLARIGEKRQQCWLKQASASGLAELKKKVRGVLLVQMGGGTLSEMPRDAGCEMQENGSGSVEVLEFEEKEKGFRRPGPPEI